MANMETSFACSSLNQSSVSLNREPYSFARQRAFNEASDGTILATKTLASQVVPCLYPFQAFEADLTKSRVYMRSISRGPRAFSIATSTQLTQSWSILSGVSLSAISNIAVQALPIYASDIGNSRLYDFTTGYAPLRIPSHTMVHPYNYPAKANARLSRTLSGRLASRIPKTKFRALSYKHNHRFLPSISEPTFVSSTYTMETIDLPGHYNISKPIFMSSTYTLETVSLPVRLKPEIHEYLLPSTVGRILSVQSSSKVVLFLAESLCEFSGGSQDVNHYPFLCHGAGEVCNPSSSRTCPTDGWPFLDRSLMYWPLRAVYGWE